MFTSYSQRDPRWAAIGLGHTASPTLRQAGCLVTSVASVLSDLADRPMSPADLNEWLRAHGGFAQSNLFVYTSLAPLGLQLDALIRCQTERAPIARFVGALEAGAGLIAMVDGKPGGAVDNHWVRVLELDDRDGRIMDPWQSPGQEVQALSSYFAPGWTSARAIYMALIFRGAEPGRAVFEDTGHQPGLCILADG